jgi:hypothetical protein
MPQQANIVINDGQATPVAHTFVPCGARQIADGKVVAEWAEKVGSRVAWHRIQETHSQPNGNGVEKMRFVLTRPVLETLGGTVSGYVPADRVAYLPAATIEVWLPERASEAELADVAAYVKNFTATTFFTDKVKKRDSSW